MVFKSLREIPWGAPRLKSVRAAEQNLDTMMQSELIRNFVPLGFKKGLSGGANQFRLQVTGILLSN